MKHSFYLKLDCIPIKNLEFKKDTRSIDGIFIVI